MAVLSEQDAAALMTSDPPQPVAIPDDPTPTLQPKQKSYDEITPENVGDLFADFETSTPNKPSAFGDVLRGLSNLKATGGGLAMLVGNATGLEGLENWGEAVKGVADAQARQNPAEIGSYENIHSAGDLVKYAKEAVLGNAAMFIPGLAGGTIGAVIGRKAAATYVENLVSKLGAEGAAKLVAKRVFVGKTLPELIERAGTYGGAYAGSTGVEAGSIYGDVVEKTGVKDPGAALLYGAGAAVLDSIPETRLIEGVLGRKLGAEVMTGLLRKAGNLGAEGVKQALWEGGTEFVQTIIEEAAVVHADPSQDLFDRPRMVSYLDALFQGAASGGAMGAGGHIIGGGLRAHPNDQARDKQKDIENRTNEQLPPDLQLGVEEITPEDVRIGEINAQLNRLEEEQGANPDQARKDQINVEMQALTKEAYDIEEKGQSTPVNENNAPPPAEGQGKVVGFKTSKGSTYEIQPDGTTIRNKAERPDHPGDSGLKPASESTFYVTPEQANQLAPPQGETRLWVSDKGELSMLWKNPTTGQWGSSPTAREIKPATEPKEGLIPLEVWQQEGGSEYGKSYKSTHFGNEIVELSSQPAVEAASVKEEPKVEVVNDKPTYQFPKVGPLPESVTKESNDAKRDQLHAVTETLVNENDNPEQATAYTQAVNDAVEPYLNLFTGENLTIKRAPKARAGQRPLHFAVRPLPNGNIEVLVPSLEEWNARNKRETSRGRTVEGLESIPTLMQHEVVHAAWYSSLRDKWNKIEKGKPPFDDYVQSQGERVGSWFLSASKGLSPILQPVYSIPPQGKKESDADYQSRLKFDTGVEMLRMITERARTGKLQEDVSAQYALAQRGGIATQAYNALVKAIQTLKGALDKFIQPGENAPGLRQIIQSIHDVLDRYGAIKPQPVPPVTKAEAKIASEPERVPVAKPRPAEEAPATQTLVNEREAEARRLAHEEKLAQQAEEGSGMGPARRELAALIRQHRTVPSPETAHRAAVQHARLQQKWGARLSSKAGRTEARKKFETTLQEKYPQAAYDRAIEEAKTQPIERAVARALPEGEEPVKLDWTSNQSDEHSSALRNEIKDWLLGSGEKPQPPTQVFRGVPKGSKFRVNDGYTHASPWASVASRGGKGMFGDARGNDLYAIPADPNTLYYRGGALAETPLEQTRILNARGMTWDQILDEGKRILDQRVARNERHISQSLDYEGWSDEEKGQVINSANRAEVDRVLSDIRGASFETDARGLEGRWSGGNLPRRANRPRPDLLNNAEIAAAELGVRFDGEKDGRMYFTDPNPDSPSFGTTFSLPTGSTPEEIAKRFEQTRQRFEQAPETVKAEDLDAMIAEMQTQAVPLVKNEGGQLLAPNGKPSKLNERQWRQVRTPNFLRWFGDWMNDPENASKVVDENGEPDVVYHGTTIAGFEEFNEGSHFGTAVQANETVRDRAQFRERWVTAYGGLDTNVKPHWFGVPMRVGNQDAVYAVFLNIRNPLTTPDVIDEFAWREEIIGAIKGGYDGLVYKNTQEGEGNSWVTFDSNQIKSAISNQGTFSGKGISNRSPELEEVNAQATATLDKVFSPTRLVNERTRKGIHRGKLEYAEYTKEQLEYMTEPQQPESFAAHDYLRDNGGALTVAERIVSDPGMSNVPLGMAARSALFEETIMGLYHIRDLVEDGDIDLSDDEYNHVKDTTEQVQDLYLNYQAELGRGVSIMRKLVKFFNGKTSKTDLIKAATVQFNRKFGKEGKTLLEELRGKWNSAAQKAMNGIITRPEFIAFMRKVQADMNNPAHRKEVRKTIATQSRKMNGMIKKAIARATQQQFGNLENEPVLTAALSRLVGMIGGAGRPSSAMDSKLVLSAAMSDIIREGAQQVGLMTPRQQPRQLSDTQKLAEILKNPSLYEALVTSLEDRLVTKMSGTNPDISRLIGDLRRQTWKEGLLEKVINEKMREMKTGMDKVARQTYAVGKDTLQDVRKAIGVELQSHGLDEDVITGLAEDMDAMMENAVDKAREKLAGEPGSVRKSLREVGLTISRAAKSGFAKRDEIAQDLAKRFVEDLGLANTQKFAHAARLKQIIQQALDKMITAERERILESILAKAQHPELQRLIAPKSRSSIMERLLEFANAGALADEQVYHSIAKVLNLPALSPGDLEHARQWGDRISYMTEGRDRTQEVMKFTNFIESRKGINWKDMTVAYWYSALLSGPATLLGVNPVSNMANLVGSVVTESIKRPSQVPNILRSVVIGLGRGGWSEFKYTWKTGLATGKLNVKVEGVNPLEHENPVYLDRGASVLGKFLSLTRAKYIVRMLQATDMMFYKAARELSFTAKTGYRGDGEMWANSLTDARAQKSAEGVNVDSRSGQLEVELRALELLEGRRVQGNEEWQQAWDESHAEALTLTYNQEPKGWIGYGAKLIAKYTGEYPIGKVFVPFTRVVANVLNAQIEWSPFGLIRWYGSGAGDFNKIAGKRDNDILIRSAVSMAVLGALAPLLIAHGDEEDPWFTIYGSGPRDVEKKRQLYERGWRPGTIKIGDSYVSYLPTPMALAFSALGTLMDKWRDSHSLSVWDIAPQAGLAFVQGTLNQSFLSGVADLFSAFESANPERQVQNFIARSATTLIAPNLLKQIDNWIDPSIQQSEGFAEVTMKQIPIVRHRLKPLLNVFGEKVHRTPGPLNIPFSQRFVTVEEHKDAVWGFLAETGLTVPSYSKLTKLNGAYMTPEQRYAYIEKAGPMVKEAIRREIPNLRREKDKEQQQDRIDEISRSIKLRVRDSMSRSR